MALSIGIDYSKGAWKSCLMENGRPLELQLFNDNAAALTYLRQTCALYPDPMIALASDVNILLTSLSNPTEQQSHEISGQHEDQQRTSAINDLLIGIGSINFNSYGLPAIRCLPGVPAYRRRGRPDMGSSNKLCSVVTLMHRLRRQEAIWQEMRLLYLDIDQNSRSIIVIEDGRVVNGLGENAGAYADGPRQPAPGDIANGSDCMETLAEQAFWEGVVQDLAGLMAIHHLDDVVVTGSRKEAAIEHLEDSYQFYHFPYDGSEGFEAAVGAAIIAEGLRYPGLAREVVERLQLAQVSKRLQS